MLVVYTPDELIQWTHLAQALFVVTPSPFRLRDEATLAVHVLVRQKGLEHDPDEEVRDVEAEHDDPAEEVPERLRLIIKRFRFVRGGMGRKHTRPA